MPPRPGRKRNAEADATRSNDIAACFSRRDGRTGGVDRCADAKHGGAAERRAQPAIQRAVRPSLRRDAEHVAAGADGYGLYQCLLSLAPVYAVAVGVSLRAAGLRVADLRQLQRVLLRRAELWAGAGRAGRALDAYRQDRLLQPVLAAGLQRDAVAGRQGSAGRPVRLAESPGRAARGRGTQGWLWGAREPVQPGRPCDERRDR